MKSSLFILSFMLLSSIAMAQGKSSSTKTGLLIVDIQNFYFPGEGQGLVHAEEASLAAKEMLQIFRDQKQLVVHVRHQSKKGFEIHKNVAPLPNEKVITKQEVNSFYKMNQWFFYTATKLLVPGNSFLPIANILYR